MYLSPEMESVVFVQIFFSIILQNNPTSFIIQFYHLCIIPKLPILQLFIPSNQVSRFPFCPIHLIVTYVNFKCLLHMMLNTSHFLIGIFVKLLHKLLCNITCNHLAVFEGSRAGALGLNVFIWNVNFPDS